jgi:hypothetical protein
VTRGPELSGYNATRARFAMFFEFKGGRIWHVRNYECFEPW